ncbi:MAG: hypothetical protein V1872_11205 [bacterium]
MVRPVDMQQLISKTTMVEKIQQNTQQHGELTQNQIANESEKEAVIKQEQIEKTKQKEEARIKGDREDRKKRGKREVEKKQNEKEEAGIPLDDDISLENSIKNEEGRFIDIKI